jgi:hypothetical protein
MSTEEFVRRIQEEHREDMEAIEMLLEILEELKPQESRIYDFCVTSNL